MTEKLICSRCKKPIHGAIKVLKQGVKTQFYDEDCFFMINKEKAYNDLRKQTKKRKV